MRNSRSINLDFMNTSNIRAAFLVGLVPATLEGLLVYFADPMVSNWVLIQSVLFWFGCGFINHVVQLGLHRMVSVLIITLMMNLPWYIALTVGANRPDHLIPLIIASVVMAIAIGAVSLRLSKVK